MAKQKITISKVGLAFVAGFAVLTVFLIAFGYADESVFNPPGLRLTLNVLFIVATNVAVAVVSARSFLRYGQISFALLSCALVVSGLTAFMSGWASEMSTNANFAIFNVGMLISSIIQAFGAVYLSASSTFKASSNRKTIIALALLMSIVSILLLTALSALDLIAPFITEAGPTPLRQFVVGLSFMFFALASIVFAYQYLRSKAHALYWYSLALALLAIDAIGSYSTTELGGVLQWVGRIAYYVGGFYFIGVLLSLRQRLDGGAGFLERWFDTFSNDPKAFAALFANMSSGFAYLRIIVDKAGRLVDCVFLEVNEAFEKNVGLKKQDIVGKRLTRVIAGIEKDRVDWIGLFGRVGLTGESVRVENYVEGLSKWFRVSAYSPQKGYVVILFDDISERKQAGEALKESEEQFRRAIEDAPIPIIMQAQDGQVLQISHAWTELTGYTIKDMPTYDAWLTKAVYAGADELRNHMFELFKGNKRSMDVEFSVRTHEGAIRCWSFSASSPGTLRDGRRFIVGMAVDITERTQLQSKLEDYAKNLEKLVEERTKQLKNAERLATIGQVAGMVGHDIRNPLQAAVSELYFARQSMSEAPESHCKQATLESLGIIQEQIDYISKIVSDLQDYAKTLQPALVEVDLCQFIPEVLKTVGIPDNIQVIALCDVSMPKLKLDQTFMRRILMNLVNNALQAMPDGGKLTVKASKKDGQVLIAVEDTGVGIPEEVKPKLFTPMFTTKAKGQGFGLPVVKRLVEAQGGTITFESEVGKGTKFIINLPA